MSGVEVFRPVLRKDGNCKYGFAAVMSSSPDPRYSEWSGEGSPQFVRLSDHQQAIDTLRAQLEAAEADWREKFEARTIDWSEASNALYVWRHRAKDAEARAEAAEANAARYEWLRDNPKSRKWEVVDLRDSRNPITFRGTPLDAAIAAAMSRTKEETK